MRYPCIIEAGEEGEEGFSVVFPDLPGCYSQGGTLEETVRMAHDAAQSWLGALSDEGEPWPHPSRQVTAREGEIIFWIDVGENALRAA